MADTRVSFIVLEDVATGAGVPLHRANIGDASAGKNAHGAFIATDAAGNFQYAKVNANRELIVSTESDDLANLSAEGGVVGSGTFQDLATITLGASAVYRNIGVMGSCFRDAVYELVWVDDVGGADTETILATFRTGAGCLTLAEEFDALEFTSGGTGVQELRLRAKLSQASPASDIDGMISVQEVQ